MILRWSFASGLHVPTNNSSDTFFVRRECITGTSSAEKGNTEREKSKEKKEREKKKKKARKKQRKREKQQLHSKDL